MTDDLHFEWCTQDHEGWCDQNVRRDERGRKDPRGMENDEVLREILVLLRNIHDMTAAGMGIRLEYTDR